MFDYIINQVYKKLPNIKTRKISKIIVKTPKFIYLIDITHIAYIGHDYSLISFYH